MERHRFSYIATRYGHFKRVESDVARHDDLDQVFDADADVKELLILVPSYKEETSVIRQTLMSAALVEYPAKRIALLIDNPPMHRASKTSGCWPRPGSSSSTSRRSSNVPPNGSPGSSTIS